MLPPRAPSHDGLWLLIAIGALVFVSPLRFVWAAEGAPWYSVFLVWALLIGATALVVTRSARGGDS